MDFWDSENNRKIMLNIGDRVKTLKSSDYKIKYGKDWHGTVIGRVNNLGCNILVQFDKKILSNNFVIFWNNFKGDPKHCCWIFERDLKQINFKDLIKQAVEKKKNR